jgi:hypothetical protein
VILDGESINLLLQEVFDRYDGRLRTKMALLNCGAGDGGGNPFGDDECGKWYARAMSNWSVLLALQGFSYDAPAQTIGFAPRFQPADHRSFFSAGNAWGTFSQQRPDDTSQSDAIAVESGVLRVRRVELDSAGLDPRSVRVTVGGRVLRDVTYDARDDAVAFGAPLTVRAGQTLRVWLAR